MDEILETPNKKLDVKEMLGTVIQEFTEDWTYPISQGEAELIGEKIIEHFGFAYRGTMYPAEVLIQSNLYNVERGEFLDY